MSSSGSAGEQARVPVRVPGKSSRNGSMKWNSRIASPTAPHPPRKRARYQWISSGRLPDQMIRYWEKLT